MTAARDNQIDAELVVAVADAMRKWRAESGREPRLKVLREAVWFFWQEPRLERPLVPPKYPRSARWSAAAASAYFYGNQRGRLVVEHIEPMNRVLTWLLEAPRTTEEVARELGERLEVVVVTKEEAARLPNDGSPDERYTSADLDLSSLKPLDQWEPEFDSGPLADNFTNLAEGDRFLDAMGDEWVVLTRGPAGITAEAPDGLTKELSWHALTSLAPPP